MKGQSKWHSFQEAIVSIAVGFVIAVLSQMIIFPAYGLHVPFSDNLQITGWFTLVSIARSYVIRRYYNYRMLKRIEKMNV